MYLVDTSAWLDYLQERHSDAAEMVGEVLDKGIPFGISAVIYQELLQGAAGERDFERISEYFGTQRFYHPAQQVESYRQAALIYFRCRRAGVTIRSTVDCVIARLAIEHDLRLIHHDRDFAAMATVISELELAPGSG